MRPAALCCLLFLGAVSNTDAKRKPRGVDKGDSLAKARRAAVFDALWHVGAGPKDVAIYRNGEMRPCRLGIRARTFL